jgi:hypothetical protein
VKSISSRQLQKQCACLPYLTVRESPQLCFRPQMSKLPDDGIIRIITVTRTASVPVGSVLDGRKCRLWQQVLAPANPDQLAFDKEYTIA